MFTYQLPRFEALQSQRVSLPDTHRNQLLGKYQLSVVPQSAKKRLSANVARGDDFIVDNPEAIKHEKELEAMTQMAMSTWHVAAIKLLNGGRLVTAPVAKRLARLSRIAGGASEKARILDLGGQATCDWAWHCALQYPNAKIYTVTTKAIRQLSNCNIRGPPNHRQVAVERLTRLPFADDQFDLISARELHGLLKYTGENGEDEWESCLKECMRVLKPGGYLEFSLLDADIMNAGPLGLAKSVEFGFALRTLGYDANPSKMWLGRLARAGFEDVRRAWVCLPMGAAPPPKRQPPPIPLRQSSAGHEVRTHRLEAIVTGTTGNVANICGLVGGWSWERWLLRCEMEKATGDMRLADIATANPAMDEAGKCLEGVHAIMEEGRKCGAAWRMLNGYAKKPRASTGLIQIQLG
jgi:SAM-dependent methyltransferase